MSDTDDRILSPTGSAPISAMVTSDGGLQMEEVVRSKHCFVYLSSTTIPITMANAKQPSFAECDRKICAPGSLFEMEDVVLHGRQQRVWKHVRRGCPIY